jgi:hypothetical protein
MMVIKVTVDAMRKIDKDWRSISLKLSHGPRMIKVRITIIHPNKKVNKTLKRGLCFEYKFHI